MIRRPTDEEQKGPGTRCEWIPTCSCPIRRRSTFTSAAPAPEDHGVNQAVLLVDAEKNVKDVVTRVAELGLERQAALEFIERERLIYLADLRRNDLRGGGGLAGLGPGDRQHDADERARADARDRHHEGRRGRQPPPQFIFLVEGGLIGLLAAGFGLLLAWAASFPGDAWVRSMVLRDIKVDLKAAIFVFPPWMAATVLLFTVLVTTLAALYPARHAARIDPVSALRHE